MSLRKNPFSVLHYADGDNNDGETEKNPVVKGKNDNRQKQKQFSDQSRMTSIPCRFGIDNGAPTQIYNGQSNGGKDNNNNGQNEINHQYGYKQGNGYGNLNDQSQLPLPPPDGDYSSEGGWNFVREKKGGTQRRRIGSLRNNSSKFGKLMIEVKGKKVFPKPNTICKGRW